MIPSRVLPDLLAAERGLARADALLQDEARAGRHACDAARRSALALARLDGTLVDPEDLLLALAASDEVALPRRTEAATAAALYRLLLALRTGLTPFVEAPPAAPADVRLRPQTVAAWTALTGDTRRLLAEAEAALRGGEETDDTAGEGAALVPPPALPPWSVAWVDAIHARWHVALHGRRPPPWSDRLREDARHALRVVEEALAMDPGVAGAARALHRLHHLAETPAAAPPPVADEDAQSRAIRSFIAQQPGGGWWPQFARLVAPQLLARACGLDRLCMPVAALWARDHTGYRLGVGGSEEDWIAATARLLADAVGPETERSARIEARHAGWIEATAVVPRLPKRRSDTRGPTRRQRAGTRRSTGRLPHLLAFLWEQPMVSTRAVERRLAMTYRSALDLIQDLEAAGVLRCATDRKLDRLWRATLP